ncbi:MAG: hypothetical protein GY811_16530 [Myxococcales bacterium]|nr:hypothetical protein [Myxococcales bacterium]
MLSKGRYHICNQCVSLCADILQMELDRRAKRVTEGGECKA